MKNENDMMKAAREALPNLLKIASVDSRHRDFLKTIITEHNQSVQKYEGISQTQFDNLENVKASVKKANLEYTEFSKRNSDQIQEIIDVSDLPVEFKVFLILLKMSERLRAKVKLEIMALSASEYMAKIEETIKNEEIYNNRRDELNNARIAEHRLELHRL